MEEVEDREMFGFVGVEGVRENNAVRNRAREDFTGNGIAFNTTGRGRGYSGKKNNKEENEERGLRS